MNPEYPVYIISKGRYNNKSYNTASVLDKLNVPYKIVVEPQEYDDYASVIEPYKILILPFSNLGQGSIPARNYVWEHSISIGAKRHWILDDNIRAFYRLNRNKKCYVGSGTIFKVVEDFADRYENIGMAGLNYTGFAKERDKLPPYNLNTRIYSCILLDNSVVHRWRGKYNEDTDLSIQILKDGLCTILFNAFLCEKHATMRSKGGNTDELYADDGRLKMAESLAEQHPDIVSVSWKFDRHQHHVDYRRFRYNKLIKKKNIIIPEGVNNYGMVLKTITQYENANNSIITCDI